MDTSSSSCNNSQAARQRKYHGDPVINDVYFRRFFVPLIVSILVLCGIAVVISTPPGTGVKWDGFAMAFGDTAKAAVRGGARRR
jgi:hypothetical protein